MIIGIIALLVVITTTLLGCNQPNGGYLPGDPCSVEGVEDCCPDCPDTDENWRSLYEQAAQQRDNLLEALRECVDRVEACQTCPPRPKPHRNTRGRGHIKHDWDVNVESDDPLEGL